MLSVREGVSEAEHRPVTPPPLLVSDELVCEWVSTPYLCLVRVWTIEDSALVHATAEACTTCLRFAYYAVVAASVRAGLQGEGPQAPQPRRPASSGCLPPPITHTHNTHSDALSPIHTQSYTRPFQC